MTKSVLLAFLLVLLVVGIQNVESRKLKEKCKRAKADILFVLDSSTTVGPEDWKVQLRFLKHLTRPFTIAKGRVRIGVIIYNTQAKYVIPITHPHSKRELQRKIMNLKYTEGLTFTGEALDLANSVFDEQGRKGINRIIILVTDGRSNGIVDAVGAARKLKREKAMIFTVGIGKEIYRKELEQIATSGHALQVNDFKFLKGQVVEMINRRTCRAVLDKVCRRRKVDISFILDSSTSIGSDDWRMTLHFVERLVDPLFIGKGSGHVALMTYNTSPRLQFLFRKYYNKVALMKKGILSVAFTEGLTFTGEALKYFRQKIFPKMRPGAAKIAVLITDGKANGELNEVAEAAKLKAKGVTLIVIGVTNNVNKKSLRAMASKHKLYFVHTFSELRKMVSKLQPRVCRIMKRKAKPEEF